MIKSDVTHALSKIASLFFLEYKKIFFIHEYAIIKIGISIIIPTGNP